MNTKLIVLAAATICGLSAQDPTRRIKADVPFGFESNGVQMAAGTYVVTAPAGDSIVKVRNVTTGKLIMLMAKPPIGEANGVNALEFKKYNGVYFLSAVKVASSNQKIALPNSRREKEMAIAIKPEVIIALGK